MEHLQTLLLPLLLMTCPPVNTIPSIADYSWNRMGGRGEAKKPLTHHMAYLQGKDNHSCAGFLVAPNWVMTTAHCLVHKPLTVILGAHTLQRKEESWQKFEVKEYYSYPGFNSQKKGKDILLLKLKGNATTNSYVKPIPFERSKVRGTPCSVAGYGTPTGTLRTAAVTMVQEKDCVNYYFVLTGHSFCGRSRSAEVPGKGDVGTPLVCNRKAYGILSYKDSNFFDLYTHITPYVSWVDCIMKSA